MQNDRRREIRKKAASIREKCKVGRYGIIDLFSECGRVGCKLVRYPLGKEGDLGFALKKDKDIIIFTNTSSRLSREIFTLAHEIGHVVLHFGDTASFVDTSFTISEKTTDEFEQEANLFAACLLMPEDEIDKFLDLEIEDFNGHGLSAMDIARMMSEFNVSFDMALNRLESLGKIDKNQRQNLDSKKNEMRVGNLLRSVGGNARLNTASNLTDLPYEYIDYALYNYNHNAVPLETLENVLACYMLSIDDIADRLVEHEPVNDDLDVLIGGLED